MKNHKYAKQIADAQFGLCMAVFVIFIREMERLLGQPVFMEYKIPIYIAGFVFWFFLSMLLPKLTGYERFPVYSQSLVGLMMQGIIILVSMMAAVLFYILIRG